MPVPSAGDLQRAALIFKALAHPHRIRLACCLAQGRTATQKELLDELGWPQSTVARHVASLRDRGLIHAHRKGNQLHLSLDGTVTPRLLAVVCDWIHPETGEQFGSHLMRAAESQA